MNRWKFTSNTRSITHFNGYNVRKIQIVEQFANAIELNIELCIHVYIHILFLWNCKYDGILRVLYVHDIYDLYIKHYISLFVVFFVYFLSGTWLFCIVDRFFVDFVVIFDVIHVNSKEFYTFFANSMQSYIIHNNNLKRRIHIYYFVLFFR